MTTILVVDDHPINREFLVTLLGYKGHRLIEAADGVEALEQARAEQPDLIITDVLMPTMDGYEFVRRLRTEPALADIPIIFHTAHYREQEARALAKSCGVHYVLPKPSRPEAVLKMVDLALGFTLPPAPPPPETFDQEHLRLLTNKLSEKVDELNRVNARLSALIDINLQLAQERDSRLLFHSICQAARELLGAKYATVSVLREGQQALRHFFTSGMDTQTTAQLGSPMLLPHLLTPLLAERRPFRSHNPGGDPETAGFSPTHPPIHSLLIAPLVSPSHIYGWLCLIDKVGAEEFSEEDERLVGILAAQVGRAYENRRLYADLQDHAEKLEREIAERKRAEEALATERQRLRALIDNLPDLIFLKDTQSRFVVANKAVAEFMGVTTPETLIGKTDFDFYPQELAAQYYALEQQIIQSGEPVVSWEKPQLDLKGNRHWLSTIKLPLRDKRGAIVGLVGVERDITKRKQAEDEVRRRNRELALLNQIIAASATGLEPEAVLEIACRELALAFEAPRATASLLNEKKTVAVVVAEYLPASSTPDQTEARSVLNQTIYVAASAAFQYLLTHQTPLPIADARTDPRLPWGRELILQRGTISLLMLPLLINGEVAGSLTLETSEPRHFSPEEINLAWSVADQVAGALARVHLAQTQQRLSAAIEQAAESVIITSAEGTIIYVNPAFEHISGYSRAEVVGQKPQLLKSGHQDAAFYEELWAAISAGQIWHGRFVNKKKDGSFYTADATIAPVRDESGAIVAYVGVQRDVTRELQLEEQYRQAQKMEAIGRLSGGVAHDFNNLLVVITGYSELLLDRHLDAASPLRKYVKEIKKAGERAAGLTRQLLAFSRQQVLQPEILKLNEVVANVEQMLQRLIGEDIDLITRLNPRLGQVKADAGQIEQIILNLAVNARDAMPRGGKLTIETANVELDETYTREHAGVEPGCYVMLAMSDTGTGMDAATQARIFEPFFTTKPKGQGTGLGLATVYGIVNQSGGDIWVYSEPGRGTTFKIYLPRVREVAPALEPEPSLADVPSGTETVLLVEDEEAIRTLARQVLEMSGYTVLEAAHGGEALLLCEQRHEPVHLLVTDVIMPHMSGREVAERLTALHPEMKVLYISGYTDQAIVHHGVLEPGLFFLQKPFSPNALVQKVRAVLDGT